MQHSYNVSETRISNIVSFAHFLGPEMRASEPLCPPVTHNYGTSLCIKQQMHSIIFKNSPFFVVIAPC